MNYHEISTLNRTAGLVKAISAIVLMGGTCVILGWIFYFWLPDAYRSLLATIKPNTALCFILSSISLWIYSEYTNSTLTKFFGQLSGAFVFLLALLTLFEYFFKINIGIDQGLFSEPLANAMSIAPPGRMSPYTATNFALIGFSLVFLDNKVMRYDAHQILMFIVMVLSVLALLGHVYNFDTPTVFGVKDIFSQMTVFSTFMFLLLSVGIVFVRPELGIFSIINSNYIGGSLARRLIPPAILFPILIGYFVGLGGQRLGFYDAELGISLFVIITIISFSGLILLNAYLIDKIDLERKIMEQKLKLSQIKLQAILNHTSAMIYVMDMEGKFVLVNKQFEKLFRKNAVDIIGKKSSELFPYEVSSFLEEDNERIIQLASSEAIEELLNFKDKSVYYLSNKFPLYNEEDIPYAVGVISTDITEIKRIHQSLHENEEQLSLALRSANAAVWSLDTKTYLLKYDDHFPQLFGMNVEAMPNQFDRFINILHPDDRVPVREKFITAMNEGDEFETEFRVVHDDGKTHYFALRGNVYRDTYYHPIKLTGVCWEITRYKETEDELRNAIEREKQLVVIADEANRAKSTFLASMSHEIRTPLNGVLGMTNLVLDTKLNSEQREYVETIRVSGEILLSVINDILDFSKIESGRMELENMDFDIHSLIYETVEVTAVQVRNKGIAIGAHIDPSVPSWLSGDFPRIRQVLNNFLSNAAKFTEVGEISVRVKLVNESETKVKLLFEVIDTGIGIPEQAIPYIFQPFMQEDSSTSRRYGGTGLGLAISKRLVELMGGEIGVVSYPERGSRFWCTLELLKCKGIVSLPSYEVPSELSDARILCVDDNAINREIVQHSLDALKIHCDVATNAAEGISMLKHQFSINKPYSLALIDHKMPGMDGIEMIQIMRQLPETKNVPVIILSSLGSTFSIDELKKLKISTYLSKPIRQSKLFDIIKAVILEMKGKTDTIEKEVQEVFSFEVAKKKLNILLAEDNVINQQVALKILSRLGYEADVVVNGYEVLNAMQKKSYDLILMDCQMPEMDGYSATEEIRKLEKKTGKHIIIIAMTAHALKGDKEKCIASGMDDYITKPFDPKVLSVLIEKQFSSLDKTATVSELNSVPQAESEEENMISIDMDRLHDIFGENEESITAFIQSFIESTNDLMHEIKEAIRSKNKDAAKSAFHRLKGSSGNSGMKKLHHLSKKAEEAVLASDWDEVNRYLGLIQPAFEELKQSY